MSAPPFLSLRRERSARRGKSEEYAERGICRTVTVFMTSACLACGGGRPVSRVACAGVTGGHPRQLPISPKGAWRELEFRTNLKNILRRRGGCKMGETGKWGNGEDADMNVEHPTWNVEVGEKKRGDPTSPSYGGQADGHEGKRGERRPGGCSGQLPVER